MRMRRRKRSKPTFFSSSTAAEDDVTAWPMEVTDVALDGDDEASAKDGGGKWPDGQSQRALQQPRCGNGQRRWRWRLSSQSRCMLRMFRQNNHHRTRLRRRRTRKRRRRRSSTPPSFTRTPTAVVQFILSNVTCNSTNFN